jgi:hypothetical protein
MVAYVALPIVVLPLLLGIVYWRARARGSMAARAVRWAVAAAALAFLAGVLMVLQGIVMSESSTAIVSIIAIGPIGLALAAVAFVVAWALAVAGQLVLGPSRRRPEDRWAVPVAWLIVVLVGAAGATLGYRAHLYGIASGAASPSTLRDLSHRLWTARDGTIRAGLARNRRTPPDVLAELVWEPEIRRLVAANPAMPPADLERLYVDPDSRVGLAENPSTPVPLLRRMATAAEKNVRWALLRNPAVPDDVLADLEHDRDPGIGTAAANAARRRLEGPRWTIMRPPYTWRWRNPFRRVFDDAAPADEWPGLESFDTQQGCEALRAEYVRRERNRRRPHRDSWERPTDFYFHTRCALRQP